VANVDLGLIGLGVMGLNLAQNLADHGHGVAVHARRREAVADAVAQDGRLVGADDLAALAAAIRKPRAVLLLVPAGKPVDDQITALLPHLEPGDIVIDGGNSHYPDTRRRTAALTAKGLHFVGLGVSGGEEGARHGPALMAGSSEEAWARVSPMLRAIAAKAGPGGDEPCCDRVGPDGAGHFVKMVHNGIEYAEMQAIAEAYALLRHAGLDAAQAAEIFARWNDGPLGSYLVEITAPILRERDPETGRPLVEVILDRAGQKGTGIWTAQAALELGVPAPTLIAAVGARAISALKTERVEAARLLPTAPGAALDASSLPGELEAALLAARLVNYAQGFALMAAASKTYEWSIPLDRVAKLWRGGCIIRARILDDVSAAFAAKPDLANLLLAPQLAATVTGGDGALRRIVALAAGAGVAVPVFGAALAYAEGYRTAVLPANLIQGQRDFFGAHTFERTDRAGSFHHAWPQG
jgi:6-phosphogluconate dehydrogenase